MEKTFTLQLCASYRLPRVKKTNQKNHISSSFFGQNWSHSFSIPNCLTNSAASHGCLLQSTNDSALSHAAPASHARMLSLCFPSGFPWEGSPSHGAPASPQETRIASVMSVFTLIPELAFVAIWTVNYHVEVLFPTFHYSPFQINICIFLNRNAGTSLVV